jgi:ribosomal-protein-alanine N-acetyltransferase
MEIRPYRPSDVARLYAIDRAAFPPALAWSLAELRHFLGQPRGRTLVAEDGGEIVAFVTGSLAEPLVGHIATLDVLPAWQGRRVGSQLLAELERWLWSQGAERIALETPASQEGAHGFYARQGYATVGRLPHYYGRRRDAYLMVKERP